MSKLGRGRTRSHYWEDKDRKHMVRRVTPGSRSKYVPAECEQKRAMARRVRRQARS